MCLLPRTTSMESGMSLMTLGSAKVSLQILHIDNRLHVFVVLGVRDFLNTEYCSRVNQRHFGAKT